MNKKLAGPQSGAKLTQKIEMVNITPYSDQCWKDNRGLGVTVIEASIYRVKFTRDGYEFPCEIPTERLFNEFAYVETRTFSEWCKGANMLEKTRKLRELIIVRQKESK